MFWGSGGMMIMAKLQGFGVVGHHNLNGNAGFGEGKNYLYQNATFFNGEGT